MSDCTVKRKWGATEWHAPDGRTIFLSADEMPCTVSVVFTDGSQRDIHIALAGRQVEHVEVDGIRYKPISRTQCTETGTESREVQTGALRPSERPQTTREGGSS